jgi:D-tyrosyl-tRNA(Tyr) deacylase
MIALLQRVTKARVVVESKTVGAIENGILALIGIEKTDTQEHANRLLERILGYRIFADTQDKMNLSLEDINGGLLIVPQFTLAANTEKGMRPSFSSAASPAEGERLFGYLLQQASRHHLQVEAGQFGADMQVSLTNDGPVTFWLQVTENK